MRSHSSAVQVMTLADGESASEEARNRGATAGFTIRGMMVVIAIAACVLAMPTLLSIAILLVAPLVAPFLAKRLVARKERKPAGYCFAAFAAANNVFYVTSCFEPIYVAVIGLCCGWVIFVIMPTVALGWAWASLACATDAVPRRSPVFAWSTVILLTVLPLATLWTLWPIRLLFFAARPQMEQLASEALIGQPLGAPQSVGLFRFAATKVDPLSGDVALLIEPDPRHPRGFLRKGGGATAGRAGCGISGSNMSIYLGRGWWYLEDD